MPQTWSNWSGSVRFTPTAIEAPADEQALCALVAQAAESGRRVRVVGAGHSSSPLVETSDLLVSLKHFQGIESAAPASGEATIRAGTTVAAAGTALREIGLALPNTGDVDVQVLAGAIGSGTHGTGQRLQNLSAMLIGMRMVTASGEVVEYTFERDPQVLRAARVALGTLGIFTALRLRLLPAFQLQRREWCTHIDDGLARLDQLIAEHRNFDFYWYPRSDLAKLRTLNPPGQGPRQLPFARCVEEQIGWSNEVLPKHRDLKFEEMEYMLPAEAGPACFQELRARVKQRWRAQVAWRVLYRTIAPDDAYLSPAYKRPTVSISLHQNVGLPYWDYFLDLEPLFRAYGGRPHWGKKHTLQAADLRPLYPEWDRFQELRRRMDPQGLFLNDYLRALLGEAPAHSAAARRTGGAV